MTSAILKSATELAICQMWEEFFDIKDIGVDADFFDLGGNSLTAIKFLSRIEKVFGTNALLPETLFSSGILKDIAHAIDISTNKK